MSEHTNGPWIWEEGTPEIRRQWNGKAWPVATVGNCRLGWHEDRNSASREAGANARLIAAAPDLLGQHEVDMVYLELLAKAIHAGDPMPELVIRVTDMLNRKRAAIAKATGEQP